METNRNCSQPGFKALMATQFFEALNDNLLKTIVSLLIVRNLGQDASALSIAAAMFVIPYLLFSSYAGFLADRFSKTRIIRLVKILEVVIIVAAAYLLRQQSITGLFLALFGMGFHSALFSPSKYGILPELVDDANLSKANGYIQFWTFVAILLGTASGGFLMSAAQTSMLIPSVALISISVLGLLSGFMVERVPPAFPAAKLQWDPFSEIFRTIKEICKDRALFLTLVALSFFWFLGSIFQLAIYLYAKEMLHADELHTALLATALALGIGIGSILAGKVSEGKVEMGLVPLGATGLAIFSSLLSISSFSYGFSLFCLFAVGLSGGFFVVPLSAFMQQHSPAESRGRYLAANNFVNFIGILGASFVLWLLNSKIGLTSAQTFLVLGCSTVGAVLAIFQTLPEAFVRCINWILMHSIYRVRVLGRTNVPTSGGALLVCNHVSFVDPSLILGALERPVRFLMFRPIYEMFGVGWVARTMKAIPVSGKDSPAAIAASLQLAQDLLKAGELVCIFAEGSITRTGNLLAFRKGFERIMDGVTCPIIPMHIDQVWGSIFSFTKGKVLWKVPREIPYPVTVSFGPPLSAQSKAFEVREAVQELSAEAFALRARPNQTLQSQFVRRARGNFFQQAVSDSSGQALSYFKLFAASLLLAKKIRTRAGNGVMVGIVLPPGVPAVLANLAVVLSGNIPINLNYTASSQALSSAVSQCALKAILTSRPVLKRLDLPTNDTMLFLEDLSAAVTTAERLVAGLQALLIPERFLAKKFGWNKATPDSIATVIFSSGSTGEPKGVLLSHRNISSNVESLSDLFQIGSGDCTVGVLPFFHSFGFTGTLWFPLLTGSSAVYHYSPLDAKMIGDLVQKYKASILMSTPTFLATYLKKCSPEVFQSLRFVVVGAEKLKTSLAQAFEERFGIAPLEGYGCTELSPVAILNVPDFEGKRVKQVGNKTGKVGHPIPGVVAQIVDPETGARLPSGHAGLLRIKGPNVMLGYLNQEDKTAQVLRDGWYDTGDIATIDQDGFVSITDRLSRFSKIGGEMVPHIKIEEEILLCLATAEPVCAVTSVADERKGERLIVLSTVAIDPELILKALAEKGMPNLWIPKRECFFQIAEIPLLGTGKLDLRALRELARQLVETV